LLADRLSASEEGFYSMEVVSNLFIYLCLTSPYAFMEWCLGIWAASSSPLVASLHGRKQASLSNSQILTTHHLC